MRKQLPHLLGIALATVPVALLAEWRWDHEIVRLYDLPPTTFGAMYLLLLPAVAVAWWVSARDWRAHREAERRGRL